MREAKSLSARLPVQPLRDVIEMTIGFLREIVRFTPEVLHSSDVEAFIITQLDPTLAALDRPAERGEPDAIVISEGMDHRALIERLTECPVGTKLYRTPPERTADARDAVIEECARVCVAQTYGYGKVRGDGEAFLSACDSAEHDGFYLAKMRCAEAIRALKSPAPLKEPGR